MHVSLEKGSSRIAASISQAIRKAKAGDEKPADIAPLTPVFLHRPSDPG